MKAPNSIDNVSTSWVGCNNFEEENAPEEFRFMPAVANAKNRFQGESPKVLCVCSAGLLRSPTMAHVLSNDPWEFNTRAAGLAEYALIPVTPVLLFWADTVLVADSYMVPQVEHIMQKFDIKRDVFSLNIPDNFERMNPTLVKLIQEKAKDLFW